jgi:hypothetical protein
MPRARKSNPTLRATLWFVVVMLPSWWVLAIALTGAGCSFETHPSKGRNHFGFEINDTDGGE